jgi:hypothetical protein
MAEIAILFNIFFVLFFGYRLITVDYEGKNTFYWLDGIAFSLNFAAVANRLF